MSATVAEHSAPPSPSGPRIGIYYAVLVIVTAVVIAVVVSAGAGKHAQPAIAGGYQSAVTSPCLGAKFDLTQSGQFVAITNARQQLSGDLRFTHGRLTGSVGCVDGIHRRLEARVAGGTLTGTVGGLPVSAEQKTDPAPAGTSAPLTPGSIAGVYQLAPSSLCLGGSLTLSGSGASYRLTAGPTASGRVGYRRGSLGGTVSCAHGGRRAVTGTAAGRALDVRLTPPPGTVAPTGAAEHVTATLQRTADETVVAFFVVALVVMLFARLCGTLMPRIGQPRVMGEVLAGIILGPTVFGAIDPVLQAKLFASDIVPLIGVAANLGLVFYMFLIGLEVDFGQVRQRLSTTLAVSNTGLALPMILGMATALPLYGLLSPGKRFIAFALFMGVSMSVTAFPVLARIVSERRMLKRPLGTLALSAAAVDDVSAWFLVALATAAAGAGSGVDVLEIAGWTLLFALFMGFVVRPLLGRAAVAYDEAGHVPGTWVTIIFAGVLLSAVTTEEIGVAVIVGAFVMGLAMPRHAGLSQEVTHRVEDFVLTLLLPLFFAYTGLRTNVGLLGNPTLILITVVLTVVAILGKYGGTLIAARVMRLPWRESAALGALMNTRGLTELIVLNLALDKGVISSALFTALVVMALVTTFMAGPALRLIDPGNSFGSPPEEELAAAPRLGVAEAPPPSRSILVAPQSDGALEPLLALAEPLARWPPPRELIIARLVRPPRGSAVRGGLRTEELAVREASDHVQRARLRLLDRGVTTRAVALASAHPGPDLVRLGRSDEIDLVLLDGRRPLLGDGVPREDVGTVLAEAPSDVGVLVTREDTAAVLGEAGTVIVPFGATEHDWAALELASWLCAATGTRLELLGPPGRTPEGGDASHMLANAALLVQQFAGISATALVAEPGRTGLIAAASHATLLVVGLSERWRQEGLGEMRRAIARAAPAPIVFVRRGTRPGALAPPSDATRFAWSSADMAASRAFSRSMSALNLPMPRPSDAPSDDL